MTLRFKRPKGLMNRFFKEKIFRQLTDECSVIVNGIEIGMFKDGKPKSYMVSNDTGPGVSYGVPASLKDEDVLELTFKTSVKENNKVLEFYKRNADIKYNGLNVSEGRNYTSANFILELLFKAELIPNLTRRELPRILIGDDLFSWIGTNYTMRLTGSEYMLNKLNKRTEKRKGQ